jgi:hypothetical protein
VRHHSWGRTKQRKQKLAIEGFVESRLFLQCTTSVPRILPTHGPRAFGEAFGIGLDGIELVVP